MQFSSKESAHKTKYNVQTYIITNILFFKEAAGINKDEKNTTNLKQV